MSEYLKFLTILFCISPSLHLRCTNAGCRARSWLIRASVTSSSSLAVEINTLRPWSWMLSYWWHELQMEGWKWEGSKMDVCSLKFGDFLEDLGNSLFPNFFCPWDVSSLFSLYNAAKALFGNPWQEYWWSLIFFFYCLVVFCYQIFISMILFVKVQFSDWPLWLGAWTRVIAPPTLSSSCPKPSPPNTPPIPICCSEGSDSGD